MSNCFLNDIYSKQANKYPYFTAHRYRDGLFFKFYDGFGRQWFNNNGAAIFYKIFWCLFAFLLVISRRAISQIPLWVFIITCILEFLQLWHPPVLQQIRATFVGRLLIGSTFSWWDFPHYAIGSILG